MSEAPTPSVVAKIHPSVVELTFPGKGDPHVISTQSFIEAMLKMEDAKEVGGNPMFLPFGTIFFETSHTTAKIMIYYPEGVRRITYGDKSRQSLLPNIVVSISFRRDGKALRADASSVRYFATNQPPEKITQFISGPVSGKFVPVPFTNIYGEAYMCWGQNAFISEHVMPNLRTLEYYFTVLTSSPFNNDLGVTSLIQPPPGVTQDNFRNRDSFVISKWFSHLAKLAETHVPGTSSFPYAMIGLS